MAPPSERSANRWETAVSEGIRATVLALGSLNLAIGLTLATSAVPARGLPLLGLAVMTAAQATFLTAVWRRRDEAALPVVVLGAMIVGMLLAVPATTARAVDTWWPSSFVISAVIYLVTADRQRGWLMGLCLVTANELLRFRHGAPAGYGRVLREVIAVESAQHLALGAAAFIAVRVLSQAGRRTDDVIAAGRDQHAAVTLARARTRRAHEVDRFVHDEILHTLRSIAMDRGAVPADRAIESARRLAGLLRELAQPVHDHDPEGNQVTLLAVLRQAGADLPLTIRYAGPRALTVPLDAANALAAATREALRNVSRHAGVDRCQVLLTQEDLAVSVEIIDAGVGFAHRPAGDRHGVADSITRRMVDLGGTAQIQSEPGAGTRVTLRWQPVAAAPPRPGSLGGGYAPRFFPALVTVSVAPVLANLWYPIWMAPHLRWPLATALTSVAVVATFAVTTYRGLTARFGPQEAAVAAVVALSASLVNGLALTPATTNVTYYWLSAGSTYLLTLIALFRSVREAVTGAIGMFLIALGCAVRVSSDWHLTLIFLPAILAPLLIVAISGIVRWTGDRFVWEILKAEEAAARDNAQIVTEEEFRDRLHERLRDREAALTGFLNRVATGGPAGLTDAVALTAARMEREVREELTLGRRADLAGRVARARRGGWEVTIRCAEDLPATGEELLAAALALLPISTAPGRLRLTISGLPRVDHWRLSLLATGELPVGELAARWAELGWAVTEDADDGQVHAVRRCLGQAGLTGQAAVGV